MSNCDVVTSLALAALLLLLAPVTAEYLYGYDESTGNLAELVGGLVVFGPLYGGAALLIRELARRTGRGWPTILALAAAFGVAQAGLIDSSMFNPSYLDIAYWDAMFRSSYVPALGINPNLALMFTVGHVIWSVSAPIAIVEGLTRTRRSSPWLGWFGLGMVGLGFVAAAAFVVWWHVDTEDFRPSAGQLAAAITVTVALTVLAFTACGRRHVPRRPLPVSAWVAGAVPLALVALPMAVDRLLGATVGPTSVWQHAESSWFLLGWSGLLVNVILLGVLTVLLLRWSADPGWSPVHIVAVAGGLLLGNVITAFAAQPIGDVTAGAKLGHNVVALILVLLIVAAAVARSRTAYSRAPGDQVRMPGP